MRHLSDLTRWLLLAAVAAATLAGCRSFNWRGQGYDQEGQAWTKDLRPPADESRLSGLDAKARDIERSLGVR